MSFAERGGTEGERQLTNGPGGRVLTNANVWSPDSKWIAFDTRSDAAGSLFDGTEIRAVHADTGEVRSVYKSLNGANCGVATWHPTEQKLVFIHGPEHPTPDWTYGPARRRGVVVPFGGGSKVNLDARDLTPPFTPGALRGGSHVHTFSPRGGRVSFTYEDHILAEYTSDSAAAEANLRTIAVGVPGMVTVRKDHPRNHDGEYFCVVAAAVVSRPKPGSDEISRAFEEAWVGTGGYLRPDGTRQRWAVAFQGNVAAEGGVTIGEVFIADIPEDVRTPGDGPLEGTATTRPRPPRGAIQRRLTFTAGRKYPGIQGPRHWLRSDPAGERVAFLLRDDNGVSQLWAVSPNGGPPKRVSDIRTGVASAFTWSPCGRFVYFASADRIVRLNAATGEAKFLTEDRGEIRPEAVVVSPDGRRVVFVRRVGGVNQIYVAETNADHS